MTPLIDFDGINAAALLGARGLLQGLIPGGKFRSLEYVVKNPTRNDRETGSSLSITRAGVGRISPAAMGAATLFLSLPISVAPAREKRHGN